MAEDIGVIPNELAKKVTVNELTQWQAYKLTKSPEFMKDYHKRRELEKSRQMPEPERALAVAAILGARSGQEIRRRSTDKRKQ